MKKIISILAGTACVALICTNILIGSSENNQKISFNMSISNSVANAESSEPSYKCFVGTISTSGTLKRWCGDCSTHYVASETGDGWCGG